MKRLLSLLCVLFITTFYINGQTPPVVIIGDQIISMAKADEYQNAGMVKHMRVGVSDEERKLLIQKFGDKIPDGKMNIVVITLYTEEEKKAKDMKTALKAAGKEDLAMSGTGNGLNVHDSARDFTLSLVNGKKIKLGDLKGKVIILDFWESSCKECTAQFEELPAKILNPFKDKNVVFLTVAKGETADKILPVVGALRKKGIAFDVALDTEEIVWKQYGKNAAMKLFVIDQKGIIQYQSTGYNPALLDATAVEVEKLL